MPPPAAVPLAGGGGRCARWVGLTSARRSGPPATRGGVASRHRAGRCPYRRGRIGGVAMTLRRVGGLVRRMLAALWVGCWLAALLVGLPWGLVALFGLPVPHHPPQQPYLREWITVAVLLVAWLVWLVLLTLVGLEVRAALRRLRMPHLRLASPPQGLLSGLVGAAVVALTTAASRGTAPAAPPPAVAAPAPPPPGLPGAVLDTAQPDGTAAGMDPAVGSLTSQPSGEQVAAAFGAAAATCPDHRRGRHARTPTWRRCPTPSPRSCRPARTSNPTPRTPPAHMPMVGPVGTGR